jgi:hypothetical protein
MSLHRGACVTSPVVQRNGWACHYCGDGDTAIDGSIVRPDEKKPTKPSALESG